MHNTYLDVLCNLGIIGLCIFLLGYLVFPLAGSYRTRDGLGLFIILSFAVAMVPETWLDRSVGCIMLGFFLSLVSAWRPDSKKYI
jgi:O-antigen ligase